MGRQRFTAQNQRFVYWPMLKSGDSDAILPQFELYRKGFLLVMDGDGKGAAATGKGGRRYASEIPVPMH